MTITKLSIRANTIKDLQKRSKDVIGVFTKTVNDLKGINSIVEKEVQDREIKKAAIIAEMIELNVTKAQNELIISKINKLIE